MTLVADTDPALAQRLFDELAQVESRFTVELLSDLACVNELVGHIERYRGKMLRPTLVLTTGLATTQNTDENASLADAHRTIAAVVEMVHMATLVHDDILDEARIRRKGVTINQLNGNETAVMLGDYLISHAYHLCSTLGDPALSLLIADATNTVCEGELLQLANRNNWELDEATYFEIIRRKTASLVGACCRSGAMLSGAELAVANAMCAYGEKLGVAFQIADDLLDLLGDEATVGKTLGRDLQKGKLTLPVIHHLATAAGGSSRGGQGGRLLDMLRDGNLMQRASGLDAATVQRIRLLLSQTDSVTYAYERAQTLARQAGESLAILPDTPARSMLQQMAQAAVTRQA